MPSRTRSRVRSVVAGGTLVYLGSSTVNGGSGTSDYEWCSDSTMPKPYTVDHSLLIIRQTVSPMLRFNGTLPYNPASGSGTVVATEFNPTNRALYQYCRPAPAVDTGYWKTRALANLNPYRPFVDLPLAIYELKDLPRMLQHAGDLLRGMRGKGPLSPLMDIGGNYLAYKFGWEAIARDVISLFSFTKQVENRKTYLRALERGSKVRRKLFDGFTLDGVTGEYALALPYRIGYKANIRYRDHTKAWFTANAKLLDPLPSDPSELQNLSRDIILGLKFQPERVWEFIPFSWLSDYFVNLGDYLEAYGTMTRTKVTRMNVMVTSRLTSELEETYREPGLSATGSCLTTVVKQRFVYANPTPTIHWTPFLTASQWAIIGALSSTRSIRVARR